MSVRTVKEMDYDEFLGWVSYFSLQPIGWRDDLRTYYIMQSSGMSELKQKADDIFPSLVPIFSASKKKKNNGELDVTSLKRSVVFHQMLGATGGDKLAFLEDA